MSIHQCRVVTLPSGLAAVCAGTVVTVVSPDQVPALQQMAASLNLKMEEEPLDSLKPVLNTADDQRTALEDLFNLQ